jgi:hypothetical protein
MELEIDFEKVFPKDDQLERTAPQNPQMEIIWTKTFDEEESFTFQRSFFYNKSKKLIIEKKYLKKRRGNTV